VPTLDPATGDMRFGMRELIQHFLNLFSHSRAKRISFLGLVLLCEIGVAFAYFAVKGF
jgi:hypothetical protein